MKPPAVDVTRMARFSPDQFVHFGGDTAGARSEKYGSLREQPFKVSVESGVGEKGAAAANLIEPVSRSHQLATRSAYATELLAAAAGCDGALPHVATLRVFVNGALAAGEAVLLRENGGYRCRLLLTVYAVPVYHSVVALRLKCAPRYAVAQPSVLVARALRAGRR